MKAYQLISQAGDAYSRIVRQIVRMNQTHAAPRRRSTLIRRWQSVEGLESRALLATFSASGATLNITLNTANESIGIVAGATTVTMTDTGGTWSGTNSPALNGNGTNVLTIVARQTFSRIQILDSAAGTSVSFNNSGVNTYVHSFYVALQNAAAGSIQFNGTTAFAGSSDSLTAITTGNITVNANARINTTFGGVELFATGANRTVTVNGGINAGGTVNLRATGNVAVAANQSISSNSGSYEARLEADTALNGSGDDGMGTLTIGTNAIVYGRDVALRGADQEIAPTATIEAGGDSYSTPSDSLTGLNGAHGVAFDSLGNMYVANRSANTVSKFSPGATTPTATLTGVNGPYNIVLDSSGNLYVSNITSGTVSKFAPGATTAFATLTGLSSPTSMAFDAVGNLYVANSSGSGVSKFAPGATTASAILTWTGNDRPQDITFDSTGNLYVSIQTSNSVIAFAPGTTTPFRTLGGFSNPQGVRFDAFGNMFVANYSNGTVSRFFPGAISPSYILTGVNTPAAMLFDSIGNLHVINQANNTVSKFVPNAIIPTVTLTGLSNPRGFAFDATGNLYVANSNVVTKYSAANSSNVFIESSVNSRPMSFGGSNTAVNGVNLTDTELTRVITAGFGFVRLGNTDQTGNITLTTVSPTNNPRAGLGVYQSTSSTGRIILDDANSATALNGKNGSIFLGAGTGGITGSVFNNSIADIATTGASVTFETSGPIGSSINRIEFADNPNVNQQRIQSGSNGPQSSSIFIDGLGSLSLGSIQATRSNASIDVTARNNLSVSGSVSSGSGTLRLAADATRTRAGDDGVGTLTINSFTTLYGSTINLMGADQEIASTAIIEAAGNISSTPSATLTGLNNARSMVVDSSGNLYVGNAVANTVSKFAPGATTPIATLTGLNRPRDLIFDSAGNLYVSNDGSGQGTSISKFAPGALTPTATLSTNGQAGRSEMAFDPAGNLYVAYFSTNGVLRFAPGATSPNATLSGVNGPSGLAFDSSGNLFVSNTTFNNISRFAPGATAPSQFLTGVDSPRSLIFDRNDNLYVATFNGVFKFNNGSTVPSSGIFSQTTPENLAIDSLGNLYVADLSSTVKKFAPGASFVSAELTGVAANLLIDSSDNLYVNGAGSTVSKFTPASAGSAVLAIESSLSSRPISLGGSNDAVSGINFTDAELSRMITPSNGQVRFGNSSQIGDIAIVTATLATTPGTNVFVEQSQSSTGRIVLDNGQGAASAFNGNQGSIAVTSGTGSIIEAATNTNSALDIANASTTTLTSRGELGTITKPLQLDSTILNSNTFSSQGNQYLKSSGTIVVGSSGLASNTGVVTMTGGAFTIPTGRTVTGNVNVSGGSILTGTGNVSGVATINSGGTINPGTVGGVGLLTVNSLIFNGGTYAADFAGDANDRIHVLENVNLNAGTAGLFVVNSASGTPSGTPFKLISQFGNNQMANAPFANAPQGSIVTLNATKATFAYNSGPNSELILYPIVSTPTNLSLDANSVTENSPTGSLVGYFSTADADTGDVFSYSFAEFGNENASFSIEGNELRTNASFDFETKSSYSIRVRTTDLSGRYFERDFDLSVVDINDVPEQISLNNVVASLTENTLTSSAIKVADIAVIDDAIGTNNLAITGPDAEFFEVIGTQLLLKSGTTLNFEVKPTFNITVQVDDLTVGSTPDLTVPYSLTLTDVNEAPTAVSLQNVVTTRPENTNTSSRIRVADILVPDDALGSNSLSVSGADAASFEIEGTQLFLKAGTTLDFETKSSFNVTVEVNDPTVGSTPDVTVDYSLSVLNVNEAPVLSAIESSPLAYVENDAPKLVTQTLVVENDNGPNIAWARVAVELFSEGVYSPEDVLTVDLGDSGLTATFNVVVPGYLELTGSATAATYQAVLRTVRYFNTSDSPSAATRRIGFFVSDGIVSNVENRYLNLTPVNDAPTGTNLNLSQTYTEDTALPLTAIYVSDVDSANATVSLTLSDAAAGSLNVGMSGGVVSTFNAGVWTASGAIADVNTLLAGLTFTPSLNYDLSVTIAVSISDQLAPAVTGLRSMTAIPVNDAPTIVSPSSAVVAENQTAAIDVNAADVDAGTTLLYSLSGPDSELFQIDSLTGVVTFKTAPNFETPSDTGVDNVYDFSVTASDGGLTATQMIAITVTDVIEDVTAPVTLITALPAASNSLTLNIAVTGNDPGSGASGVLEYDLYVSTGGAFTKFATVPVASPTTTFTGSANTTYWFRSLGRDNAGNRETKTTSDTYTRIGDIVPPATQVTTAVPNSTGLFNVTVTGTKASGSALSQFDVYVSVDGASAVLIGTASGGVASGGVYSGSVTYQGVANGASHTYAFYSRGRDGAGNIEAAPASSDVTVVYSFSAVPFTATAIDVQNGSSNRSYVRNLDVLFSSAAGVSNLLSTDHVRVERFGIDATTMDPLLGTEVTGFVLSQNGNKLGLDFGPTGLGGLRQAGNGFYRILVDMDLNGAFSDIADKKFEFHRLFGDANGDGKVDVADTNLVTSQLGRTGSNLSGDLDGNGVVNSTDRLFSTQQRGKKLLDFMLGFLDD